MKHKNPRRAGPETHGLRSADRRRRRPAPGRVLGGALAVLLIAGAAAAQDKPGPFAGPDRKLEFLMTSWEGRSADDLRSVWGRPSEQRQSGSRSFLLYEQDIRTRPGISIFGEVTVSRQLGTCQASFELDGESKITRARYRGDPKTCWDSFKRNEPPD